ncbi:GntR family transcriptional regulator [Weissella kandleri]|uniref:GntR family transcriptional regulator n=1 Tax=Weissella kandleri TaxID=1616 RepID=UPI00387E9185
MQDNMSTLQYDAYRDIFHRIMTLEFKPGEKINEKNLIVELGVSRTPIREALLKLRNDGLIRTVPQSGTYVSKINLSMAEQGMYARRTIEQQIFAQSIEMVTEEDINELQKLIDAGRELEGTTQFDLFFKQDEMFHRKVYEITDHLQIWEWVEDFTKHLIRFRWLRLKVLTLSWDLLTQAHQRILDAIKAKDTDQLIELIHTHEELMLKEKDDVIAEYSDYFE